MDRHTHTETGWVRPSVPNGEMRGGGYFRMMQVRLGAIRVQKICDSEGILFPSPPNQARTPLLPLTFTYALDLVRGIHTRSH